jgi:hypothetical protein
MTLGPCGERKSGDCGMGSDASSSSRLRFSGVVVWYLGCPLGVCAVSWVAFRLAVRFEGVCGAAGAVNLPRSLLYSLYLFAEGGQPNVSGKALCRVRTDVLICLDVVAPGFATIVLCSELLFPMFQVVSQLSIPLFDLGDAHGYLCGGCRDKCKRGGENDRIGHRGTRRRGTRACITLASPTGSTPELTHLQAAILDNA